jgi:hypothetical protein
MARTRRASARPEAWKSQAQRGLLPKNNDPPAYYVETGTGNERDAIGG